ncbi:hypothetical protein [Clostridium beijerinckii]|nr:hypothetical protein [Clostridium beijerinckii]NRU38037.1 hypothetical protein [Clostridium beijerinckii]NSA98684.1 hypothetical protein [Clostridium beijerinckii]UYZ33499.1 hypothetical protein OD350_14610 [Clostridium beijerinckii]
MQFYAEMQPEEWDEWFEIFKKEASVLLGFEVGEPEDGFELYNL